MASASALSPQERRDFEKFTKILAMKSVQIIVQSRLGDKLHTLPSGPYAIAPADWFNLAVPDIPDVAAETKKLLQGDSIISQLPLTVEISLKTVDGDQMILEAWCLGIWPDQCDPNVKVNPIVYNRMNIMLKSLLCITRTTPAYKLSRQQGSDTYIIYYRVYLGEPQCNTLGDRYKQEKVGQFCSPLGTLYISVAYRTKMYDVKTITPVQSQQGTSIMVKSDHFHSDLSPTFKPSSKKKVDLDQPMKVGAFVDTSKVPPFKESDFILPENPPLKWVLDNPSVKRNNLKSQENNKAEIQDTQGNVLPEAKASIWSLNDDDEEKYMTELPCPFATAGPVGELANFYRECHRAPPLQSFSESLTDENDTLKADDVEKQIEMFEKSLDIYDDLVSSLCQPSNNN